MKKIRWAVAMAILFILFSGFLATTASAKDVSTVKEFKNVLQKGMKNLDDQVKFTYTGSERLSEDLLESWTNDAIYSDGEIASTLAGYQYSYSDNEFTYSLSYYTTKKKKQLAVKTLDKQIATIKKTYKTQFDKVKAVNDYIVLNTTYGGTNQDMFTSYGLVNNKKAVCQGYASTAYYMLKKLGFDVYYVTGKANDEDHAWNKVKVDGAWYNLDTTWNDPVPNIDNISSYKYFLISDKAISRDHVEDDIVAYPKAKTTKYDFLRDTSSVAYDASKKVLYYANDKDNQYLYSHTMKTKKSKRVAKVRVQYLALYKNKLYFSDFSNGGKLSTMTTAGKSKKVLKSAFSTHIYIQKNYVYYKTSGKQSKLKVS